MIVDKLANDVVLGDGGAIIELERRGYVSAGPFTPQVVVEHPEAVVQLQTDFARAGAEVLQAVTYYAHEEKLKNVGAQGKLKEINAQAVAIANRVAGEYGCLVAGNICNTWVYDPGDSETWKEVRRQFDEQIEYQRQGHIDLIIAETIEYFGEAKIALDAVQDTGLPAMITLGFKEGDMTLDGWLLEDAFKAMEDAGADIVGINCFRDPKSMMPLVKRARDAVSCYVAMQPVAFRCSEEKPHYQVLEFQGRAAFPLDMDPFVLTRGEMARYALDAKALGINFIGSCCGSAPHHIRAMAEALGRIVPNSKYSPAPASHANFVDEDKR